MMRGRQMWPKERTYTALIAAMGRAFRLGDVADLVADMGSAGLEANAHTCAALLSACQRADEPELCFDLYKCAPCQHLPYTTDPVRVSFWR